MKIYCGALNGLLAGIVAFGICFVAALGQWA